MKKIIYKISLFMVLGAVSVSCQKECAEPKAPEVSQQEPDLSAARIASDNLAMGNPSGAVASSSNYWNYLMNKTQYSMSYHRDRGTPNWVSWHLDNTWLGSAPRQDDFRADATLPAGWYQAGSSSYTGSGFDRGHNCPSADRTYSITDNSATFLMTNMIPQAPTNNQQTWAKLEDYC